MTDADGLARRFEADRARLRALAYRMLGSLGEAEDAVQEAWLRLARADAAGVDNLGGWLTTVVGRVCLDMLRQRKVRREEAIEPHAPERRADQSADADPEAEMLLAESIGLALLVVLETLEPAERVAFVLHDMFDLSFNDIAPIVGRSPVAARQLASRARRRVRGPGRGPAPDLAGQRRVVDAFLDAARKGDFEALLAVLDPDVKFRADEAVVRLGGSAELRGAEAVAAAFRGRAQAARAALVDGAAGVVVAPGGRLLLALQLIISAGRIVAIDAVAEPARLRRLDLAMLGD